MKTYFISFMILFSLQVYSQEKNENSDKARRLIVEGNSLYQEGDFDGAMQKYAEAYSLDGENLKGTFNLGNAAFRLNDFSKAAEMYENYAALIKDKNQQADAFHNLGNSYLLGKKTEEAIAAYKKALRIDPTREDTRYNLAYAQKMLQQEQQQQQQNQDQQNQDQQNQDNKENQDQKENKENEDKKNDQDKKDNKDKKNDQNGDEKKDPNDPQNGESKPQPNQLSKEQAKQLLDALQNKEKELQDEINKKKQKVIVTGIEKDW